MIIDATDLILGRMCTAVAKKAMLGEKIDVINCEKAVISGSRADIIAKYQQKWNRTTIRRGPFLSRTPDRFVRRIIRGMLPYKQMKGDVAYKRVMCYVGVPQEFATQKHETVTAASAVKRQLTKYTTVHEVCKELGSSI